MITRDLQSSLYMKNVSTEDMSNVLKHSNEL